jgi:hypothetical protein
MGMVVKKFYVLKTGNNWWENTLFTKDGSKIIFRWLGSIRYFHGVKQIWNKWKSRQITKGTVLAFASRHLHRSCLALTSPEKSINLFSASEFIWGSKISEVPNNFFIYQPLRNCKPKMAKWLDKLQAKRGKWKLKEKIKAKMKSITKDNPFTVAQCRLDGIKNWSDEPFSPDKTLLSRYIILSW